MNKIRIVLVLMLVLLSLGIGVSLARPRPAEVKAVYTALEGNGQNYARVTGPMPLEFPRDFGAHPDYQTEWWYFTGNLSGNGRRFGYELTFFRRAILAPDQASERGSAWGASQVYLAHFALTNVSDNAFSSFERIERGAAGLAGVEVNPLFHVWLHDWSVTQTGGNTFHLTAKKDGIELSLDLQDIKGPVLQGDRGYSQKGPAAGNASTYVSLTRLETGGSIRLKGDELRVNGLSWMDHEYGTSALGPGQVGWDWFSIQLEDGSEIMAFQIRDSGGQIDPYSQGTIVSTSGGLSPLKAANLEITPLGSWKSPHSGAIYPSAWRVKVPSAQIDLEITPLIADQELNLSFVYWEGTVQITGTVAGKTVRGNGYVELTGYARSMAGQF